MAVSVRDVAGGIADSVYVYEMPGEDDWEDDFYYEDWDDVWDDSSEWADTDTTDDSDYLYYDSYWDSYYNYEYGEYKEWDSYYGDYEVWGWLSLSKAQKTAKDNSHVIAGVSFGVIGLASALALLSVCNKKKISENEQALLQ